MCVGGKEGGYGTRDWKGFEEAEVLVMFHILMVV